MSHQRVVGFGALNTDLIYEISSSTADMLQFRPGKEQEGILHRPEEVLKQLEQERLMARSGGGSAANFVTAVSGLGVPTGFIGRVGSDEEAEFLLSTLSDVDTSRVIKGQGESGKVISLQTQNQKDRFLLVFPGENDALEPSDVDINYINQGGVLHITSFVGEQSFQAQIETLRRIDPGVIVSFDGGELYARRGISELQPFLERSNIIFPSEQEVVMLTGWDYKEGARQLLSLGPDLVVVTRGSEGCFIISRQEELEVPSFYVPSEEIKDTIGAGDVFAGSFLVGLLENRSLFHSANLANYCAAKSIRGVGRSNYPTREDRNF